MTSTDEFIQEKIPPQFHDLVELLRDLMRESAPQATEKVGYGMLMWSGRWPLAWITPGKEGVSFGFRAGAYFGDPFGLLKGTGKHARNVKLKGPADVNREALRHYVRQALEHDGLEQ